MERDRGMESGEETVVCVRVCVFVSFSREEQVFLKPLRRSVWEGRFLRDDRED